MANIIMPITYCSLFNKCDHMKRVFTALCFLSIPILSQAQPVVIGNTTYDFQTYSGNHNRIVAYTDGKITAGWLGSDGFAATFNDRGMFVNHFNGASWGAFPANRAESKKSYDGDLLRVLDHEVVVTDEASTVMVHKNSSAGATDWTATAGSEDIDGYYPVSYCPAGSDDIYVVAAKKTTQESLMFNRSDDGGETWAVAEYALPYAEEAYGIDFIASACYQVVAKGNDVYVLYGANFCDMILMHSDSKGDIGTWTSQVLVNFPIDNFDGAAGETTDFDGDGDKDTIASSDGKLEMIIEDDGTVHVFSGRIRVYDPTTAAGYYYIPKTDGIWYWKTGMASAIVLDAFIDWNNADGLNNPYGGIGTDYTAYGGEGVTSFPTAAWDPVTDKVFLMYMSPVEYQISLGNQTRYDVFGMYTEDDGDTWTSPVNLTYTTHLTKENAYPSAYPRVVDGAVHVTWQEDAEPGTAVDVPADAIITSNILYAAWPPERFDPYNPTVDFSYVLVPFGGSFNATFTNLSVDAETYYWTFGDGGTSTLKNPTHTYVPGEYEVCLTAYNVYGEATVCETIVAFNEPVADFTSIGDPEVAFIDLSSGDPTSYFWDFDDGFTSTESDPVHTFAVNGTYNVCLTVSNVAGSDTHCEDIIIDSYLSPTAYFIYSGDPTVTFTDLSIGGPTSWAWNFDDGFTSTLQNPTHTYAANGVYNVCLTATNGVGSNTTCQDVTIDYYVVPVVDFSFTGDPTTTFTDLSTNSPIEWAWDFDDGFTSTLQNPVHTFPTNGSYDVCLTATNLTGSATECKVVIIDGYLAPVATFNYTGDPVVTFNDLSTNSPTSWFWDFGDGDFSSLENPVHDFVENGTYSVCLTVSNPGGVDEDCQNVVIDNGASAPVVDFEVDTIIGLTVVFNDLSINDPTDWLWDFGDGAISGLQNPVHTYAILDIYTVCLTATNDIGSEQVCKQIDIATGINNTTNLAVNIYPNPASNIIAVDLPAYDERMQISLLNIAGQELHIDEKIIFKSSTNIQLNVADLPSANYIIRLTIHDNIYLGKFFKD
jgi:PKD repeat protein